MCLEVVCGVYEGCLIVFVVFYLCYYCFVEYVVVECVYVVVL